MGKDQIWCLRRHCKFGMKERFGSVGSYLATLARLCYKRAEGFGLWPLGSDIQHHTCLPIWGRYMIIGAEEEKTENAKKSGDIFQ